jgi:hypothetical protein
VPLRRREADEPQRTGGRAWKVGPVVSAAKGSGEAVRISYTEATLNARGQFAKLRMLTTGRSALDAEIDRLTDVLTDAYHARDGMVTDELYTALQEDSAVELQKAEDELSDLQQQLYKLEDTIAEQKNLLETSESDLRRKLAHLLVAQPLGQASEAR